MGEGNHPHHQQLQVFDLRESKMLQRKIIKA